MSNEFDVAIIGAGVCGGAIARRLSAYDIKVVVLEKCADVSFGVSKANSGIVHAGFHHPLSSLKANLELKGNLMFEQLCCELGFPFKRVGILVAAFSDEEMRTIQQLYERGRANGVPNLEIVGAEKLRKLEPKLSDDAIGALYAPSGGIVEPYRYVFALMESAMNNGVELMTNFEVSFAVRKNINRRNDDIWSEDIGHRDDIWSDKFASRKDNIAGSNSSRSSNDVWRIKSKDGRSVIAKYVVNAAGLFSDEVSKIFKAEDFNISVRKGEEYLLQRDAAGFTEHVIFPVPTGNSKGMLVIPTVEGTMMVGPTAEEIDNKADLATTEENLHNVFAQAKRMVPAVSSLDIITSFVGLRPTLPGGDFYIDISEKSPDFIQVAGIQSPGLTASPAIGEYVKELLKKAGLTLTEKSEYCPELKKIPKLRELSPDQAAELVEKDPKYGNVVCRCENVSEAEIVHAIQCGHTTIDGIKFYTRAGMGRCQGGFCTYKIMQILQRETGMSAEEISKRGNGSELVVGKIGCA